MNTKSKTARDLALELCRRSACRVGMAAVLSDNQGIFSWGWNHAVVDGGKHAEQKAFKGANRYRLKGATLTVAGIRKKNKRFVYSMPCAERCMKLVLKHGIKRIDFIIKSGEWKVIKIY